MAGIKRRLTIEEQIAHMKHKGVQFRIMDEAVACDYLHYNSNYFKLAAYRFLTLIIDNWFGLSYNEATR